MRDEKDCDDFAVLDDLLCSHDRARPVFHALEDCTDLFNSQECANYFESCGYDPVEILALDTT